MVDSRNVVNTFATCAAVACALTLLWLAVGYSLVYGQTGGPILGGLDASFLKNMNPLAPLALAGPRVPAALHAVFQSTYASITPCLIIGAYVGRMRFFPSIALCAGWMLAVYCPFARMVWGGGLLEHLGLIDFAGGIVIHITAGAAALCVLMPKQSLRSNALLSAAGCPPCTSGPGAKRSPPTTRQI
jgi:Amt family ammonium transporter